MSFGGAVKIQEVPLIKYRYLVFVKQFHDYTWGILFQVFGAAKNIHFLEDKRFIPSGREGLGQSLCLCAFIGKSNPHVGI